MRSLKKTKTRVSLLTELRDLIIIKTGLKCNSKQADL